MRLGSGLVASQLGHCTIAVHSLCDREQSARCLDVCTAVVINPFNEADAIVEVAEGAARFVPATLDFDVRVMKSWPGTRSALTEDSGPCGAGAGHLYMSLVFRAYGGISLCGCQVTW